jgi:hypothetical protein
MKAMNVVKADESSERCGWSDLRIQSRRNAIIEQMCLSYLISAALLDRGAAFGG